MKKERCENGLYEKQCRKRARYVIGYMREWGKRVDMQKGMVPCYTQSCTFRCEDHKDDMAGEDSFLGILPIERYYEARDKEQRP